MKKGLGGYHIGLILLVLAIAGVFIIGPWTELGAISSCQNIYGYYPAYRCCDETMDWQGSKTLTYSTISYDNGQTYKCPDTASHCEVILSNPNFAAGTNVYKGITNCRQTGLFGEAWICDDDEVVPIGVRFSVPSGTWVHLVGQASVNIEYEHYRYVLCDCSISPCGVPCPGVLGADGCGFNTNMDIYDQLGRIKITADAQGSYAYTVPLGSCYTYYPEINRHVIGDTCEECSDDSDCASRYGDSYTYLGTEYGATCGAGYVQLYSCQDNGAEVCVKWREDSSGFQQECLEYGQQTRCDLYLSIPVQCCPGTNDCGPNAFCNPDTYMCEDTAECTQDTDCGHTIQCDYADTTLNTPVCQAGECTFDERDVDCCGDINCPDGWYCAADYTCKEKTDIQDPCPYQCCAGEEEFFDRPCAPGLICCDDHTCQQSCDGTGADNYWGWLIIPVMALLLGAIGYWAGEALGAVILGVIGGLLGYIVWWFTQLEAWAQFLLLLGLGGLGVLGIYLLGGFISAVIIAVVVAAVKK